MKRPGETNRVEGWRQWLLGLTLCVFAFAYGAPTSLAAHGRMPHAATSSGCPESSAPAARGATEPHADSLSGCCIVHCLPAAPMALPAIVEERVVTDAERVRLDEDGTGLSVPVPLPPPRHADRA